MHQRISALLAEAPLASPQTPYIATHGKRPCPLHLIVAFKLPALLCSPTHLSMRIPSSADLDVVFSRHKRHGFRYCYYCSALFASSPFALCLLAGALHRIASQRTIANISPPPSPLLELSWSSVSTDLLLAELARRDATTKTKPQCGSGDRGSYNTPLHIAALALILLVSTLGTSPLVSF